MKSGIQKKILTITVIFILIVNFVLMLGVIFYIEQTQDNWIVYNEHFDSNGETKFDDKNENEFEFTTTLPQEMDFMVKIEFEANSWSMHYVDWRIEVDGMEKADGSVGFDENGIAFGRCFIDAKPDQQIITFKAQGEFGGVVIKIYQDPPQYWQLFYASYMWVLGIGTILLIFIGLILKKIEKQESTLKQI